MKNEICSLCGLPIYPETASGSLDIWQAIFTTGIIGSTQIDREQRFMFHKNCYEQGKSKLYDLLTEYHFQCKKANLGPGVAWITYDPRDPEISLSSSQLDKKIMNDAIKYSTEHPPWEGLFTWIRNNLHLLISAAIALAAFLGWLLKK